MKQLTFAQEYKYRDSPDGITIPTMISYSGKTIITIRTVQQELTK